MQVNDVDRRGAALDQILCHGQWQIDVGRVDLSAGLDLHYAYHGKRPPADGDFRTGLKMMKFCEMLFHYGLTVMLRKATLDEPFIDLNRPKLRLIKVNAQYGLKSLLTEFPEQQRGSSGLDTGRDCSF